MLPTPLVPFLIVVAALVPGYLALSLCGPRLVADRLERGFIALALGLLGLGWVALVLAETGFFSLAVLGVIWLIATVLLGLLHIMRRGDRLAAPPSLLQRPADTGASNHLGRLRQWLIAEDRWELLVLAVWAVVATVFFFRPHEFVIGGADAGVYVNLGANIDRTGRLLIPDPVLAGLNPALDPVLLRALPSGEGAPYYLLPGFYVPGTPRGLVVPQFYALHPVWIAVGYGLSGVRGALLLTPLWALLGCLACYLTLRQLCGRLAALLALAALTVCALQVWFARYPTAEMLTQYLFWTGAWACAAWLNGRQPRGLWAGLAGVALGEVLLARIDMYFLLAIPVLIAAWLSLRRSWHRADGWFFLPLSLLAVHSLLHGMLLSGPYFALIVNYGRGLARVLIEPRLAGLTLAALIVGIGLFVVWRRSGVHFWLADRGNWWRAGSAVAVAGLALYGYFLRPRPTTVVNYAYWYGGGQVPILDQENLVRLGWYLTPLGLALAVAGIGWLIVKLPARRTALILGTGLFFTVLYLWRIQANPHQIYTMRRYVPVVMPFFIMAAAAFLAWLMTRSGFWRWIGIGLALLWLAGIMFASRGFVSQVDYRGLIVQLDQLNARFTPHSVLVFNDPAPVGAGDILGTPLHFLYGHDVYTVRSPHALTPALWQETLQAWQDAGRTVYWVSVPGGSPWPGSGQKPDITHEVDLAVEALEGTYDHKPYALVDMTWQLLLAQVREDRGQ